MIRSAVRQRIAQGEEVLTAKVCYTDPELVELVASAGFDAIWLCLEHRRIEPTMVGALVQACRLGGADALVRLRPSNYADVLWLLEAGARGLMLPRVRHPDEVREIIAAMKFPPVGRRGWDPVHADANFGRLSKSDYMEAANRESFLVIQIEEPEVLPHVGEIAALPEVDVLFIGPGDLSLGLGTQAGDPAMQELIRDVAATARKYGKRTGIPCAPSQVPVYRALGLSFFNILSDYRAVFDSANRALAAVRPSREERENEPLKT